MIHNISKNKIFVKNPYTKNNSIHGYKKTISNLSLYTVNKFYDIITDTIFIHELEDYKNIENKVISKKTDSWKEVRINSNDKDEHNIIVLLEPLFNSYYGRSSILYYSTNKNLLSQNKFYISSDKQSYYINNVIRKAIKEYNNELTFEKYNNTLLILPNKRMVINLGILPEMYWIFNFLKY